MKGMWWSAYHIMRCRHLAPVSSCSWHLVLLLALLLVTRLFTLEAFSKASCSSHMLGDAQPSQCTARLAASCLLSSTGIFLWRWGTIFRVQLSQPLVEPPSSGFLTYSFFFYICLVNNALIEKVCSWDGKVENHCSSWPSSGGRERVKDAVIKNVNT